VLGAFSFGNGGSGRRGSRSRMAHVDYGSTQASPAYQATSAIHPIATRKTTRLMSAKCQKRPKCIAAKAALHTLSSQDEISSICGRRSLPSDKVEASFV
jgi:hypothetical protein